MSMKKKNNPAFHETKTDVYFPKPAEKPIAREKAAPTEKAIPEIKIAPMKKTIMEEKITPVETAAPAQGIQKEYLDGKKLCQVTFRLPKPASPNGQKVFIVGDFNNWNIHAHQMKKQKNGDHVISLSLSSGREYQFRYLIDDSIWENDWKADKYAKSPFGNCDNSVVIV